MANKKIKTKEKFLETLLKEGKRYLVVMEQLSNCFKQDLYEYKNILFILDHYSRSKIQLREAIEELREMYDGDIVDGVEDDEDTEEDEMEYMEVEMEGFINFDEEDFFLEEQFRHFYNIMYRKNILANTEMFILRMLYIERALENFLLSVLSNLKAVLKNYCEKVRVFLKCNQTLVDTRYNFKKKKLMKNVRAKYKQLHQLLAKITKKQIFFAENVA